MKKSQGFTLIELVTFIAITSILASTLLLTLNTALTNIPKVHYTLIASQLANQCMEGFISERGLLGYSNASLACSASPTLPTVCSAPSGYTISAAITCTPTLSGDTTTSKTVTVNVTGSGSASLTTLLANY